MKPKCKVHDCKATKIAAKGMCWRHYRRWKRTGNIHLVGQGKGKFCKPGTVAVHQRGTLRISEDLIPAHLVGKPLKVEITFEAHSLRLRFMESGSVHSAYTVVENSLSVFVVAQKALRKLGIVWPGKGEPMREYQAKKSGANIVVVDFQAKP